MTIYNKNISKEYLIEYHRNPNRTNGFVCLLQDIFWKIQPVLLKMLRNVRHNLNFNGK